MATKFLRTYALTATLPLMLLSTEASAQSGPVRRTVDEHGVDLLTGHLYLHDPELSIGPDDNGLALVRHWSESYGWFDNYYMIAAVVGTSGAVEIDRTRHTFTLTGGVFVSDQRDGATLTSDSTSIVYTDKDGTIYTFDKTVAANGANYHDTGVFSAIASITKPNGLKTYFTYKRSSYVAGGATLYAIRLQSVTNSAGYQFRFSYANNTLSSATIGDWERISDVLAINNAVDYCDPTADSCSFTQSWPHVAYSVSGNVETVTASSGWTKSYTTDVTNDGIKRLVGSRSRGSCCDDVTYGYATPVPFQEVPDKYTVISVNQAGFSAPWNYSYTGTYSQMTVSITTPTIPNPRVSVIYNKSMLISTTDENLTKVLFGYDAFIRKNAVVPPDTAVTWVMDGRGNTTESSKKKRDGSAPLTSYTTYPTTCSNLATCNKPITTTDANGNVTNYYYNANGTLDYVQAPAPTVGAPRPEVHYAYAPAQAWLKNASGNVVASPDIISLLSSTTTCITGAWPCAPADQRVTSYTYYGGPSATNLLLQSTTTASGTGTPGATTSYGYDSIGNVTAMTGPDLVASAYTYDADRQVTFIIGADPDGTGPLKRRALTMYYGYTGLLDTQSVGTVDSSDIFTPLQRQYTRYDTARRKISERQNNGSADSAMTQYSYDGAGRLQCTAIRMTPSVYVTLPPSACTQSTSANDDLITQNDYENAGLISVVHTGVGTAFAHSEMQYTHTPDGLTQTLTDAKGNVTTYEYDGYDRLAKTRYPNPTGGGSSTTDYVAITSYDANSNPLVRTLRGNPSALITTTYDGLNRPTHVSYPGGSSADPNVDYYYDNLGQLLSGVATNGHTMSIGYDALGNKTSEGDALSAMTMQYDAAGRRTRTSWADGFYVTYDYNALGEMTAIRENGSTALATFSYNDLGQRIKLLRGNGSRTNYSYDAAARLGGLALNLPVGAPSTAYGFTYSAAGQITQRTASNDAYVYTGAYDINRDYTSNGLNQYTLVNTTAGASVSPTYDNKGNLASAGTVTYSYNVLNQLSGTSGTNANGTSANNQVSYDPAGRMDAILDGGGATLQALQHDGATLVTERGPASAGSPIQRRYVHGPNTDEPLVWYEGAGTGDKRYLMADERGSIVAVTDGTGQAIAINSYDAYGIPKGPEATKLWRFQYTGQAWIPELGMYDYKARIYSPTLGRFLQTDPTGYDAGMNLYNYASGDPVNRSDPTGLNDCVYCSLYPPPTSTITWNNSSWPGGNSSSSSSNYGAPYGPIDNSFKTDFGGQDALWAHANRSPYYVSATVHPPEDDHPPYCTGGQVTAQNIGLFLAHIGAKTAKAGDAIATVGGGIAFVSTASILAAPPGWGVGGTIAAFGGMLSAGGRLAVVVGGVAAIAGGASIRKTGSQIIVDMLPLNFLYHGAATRGLNYIMDFAGVPDRPGCINR